VDVVRWPRRDLTEAALRLEMMTDMSATFPQTIVLVHGPG
jgi:hypothetical protein